MAELLDLTATIVRPAPQGSGAPQGPGASPGAPGWFRAMAPLPLGILTTLLILWPVLVRPGWPYNHEYLAPILRMRTILGQWGQGRWIPVWSTTEQWQHGSASPIIYHKLFSYVSSALLGLTGDEKLALCLALGLFLLIGFMGMVHAMRLILGRQDILAPVTAGAMLLACNYTTTDWLIRGAFAELAGLAMLAWVFAWMAGLVVRGRWSLSIGPIMALTFLGHSVIAFYSLVPLLLALAGAVLFWGRHRALGWMRPALLSVALCFALLLPFLLPMLALTHLTQMGAYLQTGFNPFTHKLPLTHYLADPQWVWGRSWQGFTVQIDAGLLVGLVALVALLAATWRWPATSASDEGQAQLGQPCLARPEGRVMALVLLATVLVMAFMLTPLALPLYRSLPGLAYIQFSWRLLSFISVALCLCAAMALEVPLAVARGAHAAPRQILRVLAGLGSVALLVSTLGNKPAVSPITYDWFTADMLRQRDDRLDNASGGEFLPQTALPANMASVVPMQALLATDPNAGSCSVLRQPDDKPDRRDRQERRRLVFAIDCAEAGTVVLPVFWVQGLSVAGLSVTGPASAGAATVAMAQPPRGCQDPRLRLRVPAGALRVTLHSPSWFSVVSDYLLQPLDFDYANACATASAGG